MCSSQGSKLFMQVNKSTMNIIIKYLTSTKVSAVGGQAGIADNGMLGARMSGDVISEVGISFMGYCSDSAK